MYSSTATGRPARHSRLRDASCLQDDRLGTMKIDHFQSTLGTWILQELAKGPQGRLNVNQHVMETYAWPLKVYFMGSSWRGVGEPDDILNGFFASRLSMEQFFAKWSASGLRLRRWLMNSLLFYLKELRHVRHDAPLSDEIVDDSNESSQDPASQFDREAAIAFVRQALVRTEAHLTDEGMQAHYRMFLRHHLDGAGLRDVSSEFGIDAARAGVMVRTARRRFEAELTQVLMIDGVPENDIEEEIQSLLQAMVG